MKANPPNITYVGGPGAAIDFPMDEADEAAAKAAEQGPEVIPSSEEEMASVIAQLRSGVKPGNVKSSEPATPPPAAASQPVVSAADWTARCLRRVLRRRMERTLTR